MTNVNPNFPSNLFPPLKNTWTQSLQNNKGIVNAQQQQKTVAAKDAPVNQLAKEMYANLQTGVILPKKLNAQPEMQMTHQNVLKKTIKKIIVELDPTQKLFAAIKMTVLNKNFLEYMRNTLNVSIEDKDSLEEFFVNNVFNQKDSFETAHLILDLIRYSLTSYHERGYTDLGISIDKEKGIRIVATKHGLTKTLPLIV